MQENFKFYTSCQDGKNQLRSGQITVLKNSHSDFNLASKLGRESGIANE
jgi:hypothetical protein